jgi:hypothetical protein
MPIRINLLAEMQALEEERRRDPVKRLVLAGVVVVALILAYSSTLLVNTVAANSQLNGLNGDLNSRTNEYRQILESQKILVESRQRLDALRRLSTNRFLVGNFLNALQKVTDDNVQLMRLKIDQTYTLTEEAKPADSGERVSGKPATANEKIMLTLNAKDIGNPPGNAFKGFQEALSGAPYFQEALGKTNGFRLANYGAPQSDPDGKSFVLFTLEANFPEKKR